MNKGRTIIDLEPDASNMHGCNPRNMTLRLVKNRRERARRRATAAEIMLKLNALARRVIMR